MTGAACVSEFAVRALTLSFVAARRHPRKWKLSTKGMFGELVLGEQQWKLFFRKWQDFAPQLS